MIEHPFQPARHRAARAEDRILLTGDHGFVGRHALSRWPNAVGFSALTGGADIRDRKALDHLFDRQLPQAVVHMAAVSFVPESFRDPERTFDVNVMGTLRLLEALAARGFTGRFLYVGSGDAYGVVPAEELPIDEARALRPRNPYAASKAAAEAVCYQWSQTGPFEVVIARPFNHIGPGQAPTFALSDFARQIAEIAAGLRPPALTVGNIDVTRDVTHVGDVIHAYELLLQHGQNGETYNVCSGEERSLRSLLERLLELAGVRAEIAIDPARFRPSDQPRVCGSHEKLTRDTGWQPSIPLDESLLSLYRYWERRVGK